jgi:hypothetical protein
MNTENTIESSVTLAPEFRGTATYCPEDNKLRLYVGRVPREEFLKLRAEGWTTLHKQRDAGGGDFAATWTPSRRDTALEYAGIIEDEDAGPAERAADRAERFSGYRDKRTREAVGHADRYVAGPAAHGYQSQARAERAAARHDRMADRAGDAWGKAEYWTRRTAGVIAHALYKSKPDVRMGRIKVIEAEIRKLEKDRGEIAERYNTWKKIAAMTDPDKQTAVAARFAGLGYGYQHHKHPVTGREGSLWDFLREDAPDRITGAKAAEIYLASSTDPESPEWNETRTADWIRHLNLRLSYENQMLEAQGGRAAHVEMIAGGFIGSHQIHKVNKSPATGRVVSVLVKTEKVGGYHYRTNNVPGQDYSLTQVETERLPADSYRAPTAEELAAFLAERKAEKAAAPKKVKPPLINPTDADAERLQAIWNERARVQYEANPYAKYQAAFEPSTVCRIPQAVYSANSKGSCARAETNDFCADARQEPTSYSYRGEFGPVICQIRTTWGDGNTTNKADRVIIITDKPQKPLPAAMWEKYVKPEPAPAPESDTCYAGRDSRGLTYTVNA